MTITKEQNGTKLCLFLAGRLDTTTAPQLEAEIRDSLAGIELLVLDFKELQYISSAGLRVLLGAQKTMSNQGSMELLYVNENIMEIFEITGFCDILTIKAGE